MWAFLGLAEGGISTDREFCGNQPAGRLRWRDGSERCVYRKPEPAPRSPRDGNRSFKGFQVLRGCVYRKFDSGWAPLTLRELDCAGSPAPTAEECAAAGRSIFGDGGRTLADSTRAAHCNDPGLRHVPILSGFIQNTSLPAREKREKKTNDQRIERSRWRGS
jgi:hypothetical protein